MTPLMAGPESEGYLAIDHLITNPLIHYLTATFLQLHACSMLISTSYTARYSYSCIFAIQDHLAMMLVGPESKGYSIVYTVIPI